MANPRQRRKLRSGSHKPVHHSRRAKTLLKKQPPIRGPKVLQDAWDKHKTVRQNYEALGLLASLNPISSGGVEQPLHLKQEAMAVDTSNTPEASTSQNQHDVRGKDYIPKGHGRIIRDENGNVVDVEIADEESESDERPGDRLIEDIPDPSSQEELAGWVALGTQSRKATQSVPDVVQSLEEMSKTGGGAIPRFTSSGERNILRKLVAKYDEDVDAMARDRKLNPDQRTAGELRRAIAKAGGFAALRG
ncbi:hypothetical protein K474DRAFT_1658515 [Panus rudis PR-1116 ss-1]|nr:hypothetical protein K474DRAFT_1658515 [Panus rudis PR-1116 ss-1]